MLILEFTQRTQDGWFSDFGAVKQITTSGSFSRKTKFTVAIGTPGYVPSEQAHGNPKLSSDIYAVGIIGIKLSPDYCLNNYQKMPILMKLSGMTRRKLALS